MDITLDSTTRNPATGRFNFARGADGDVAFDDTEAHAVVTAVLEERKKWWADQNSGSDLYTVQSLTARTPSQAEAMIRASLSLLEAAGAISVRAVVVTPDRKTQRLVAEVTWTTPSGAAGKASLEL
jgi:hypothetical protein